MLANAFSGIWWAVSTLLTAGCGDIYPVTTVGKEFFIIMIKHKGKVIIPNGNTVMMVGDKVIMYTQMHISHAHYIQI